MVTGSRRKTMFHISQSESIDTDLNTPELKVAAKVPDLCSKSFDKHFYQIDGRRCLLGD
jgi:hypothetical protein